MCISTYINSYTILPYYWVWLANQRLWPHLGLWSCKPPPHCIVIKLGYFLRQNHSYSLICRHPDKNKEEGATEKFMKINEAYETLSDKDKRQQYDNFGTTSAQAEQRNPFQQGNPFEQFFHGSPFQGFRFNFGERESPFAKHRITLRWVCQWNIPVFPSIYQKSCEL